MPFDENKEVVDSTQDVESFEVKPEPQVEENPAQQEAPRPYVEVIDTLAYANNQRTPEGSAAIFGRHSGRYRPMAGR